MSSRKTTSPAQAWHEPLPNDPSLLGLALYTQAFVVLAGANAADVLATRALEGILGY